MLLIGVPGLAKTKLVETLGVVLGFHTRIDSGVADIAKHQGVQIKLYSIIYELVDEVKAAMAGHIVGKATLVGLWKRELSDTPTPARRK